MLDISIDGESWKKKAEKKQYYGQYRDSSEVYKNIKKKHDTVWYCYLV